MSQYFAVGISAPSFTGSGTGPGQTEVPVASTGTPIASLFSFMSKLGLDVNNALTHPAIRAFMLQAGIKAEEVRAEQVRREQKTNLLLWGGVAAGILFLALRKK